MPGTPLAVRSQRRTSSPRAIPLWGADRRSHLRLRIQRRILQCRHRHGLPLNYYDPSGEFGLLVGTAIAAGISGLISGGVSAYQSYKSTGSVNWKAAGQAALGGAVSAVAVGLAVATGDAALGLTTMAVEAYAGVRTAMRGGDAAAVTTATAKTGAGAYVAGVVAPYIPSVGNFIIGSASPVMTIMLCAVGIRLLIMPISRVLQRSKLMMLPIQFKNPALLRRFLKLLEKLNLVCYPALLTTCLKMRKTLITNMIRQVGKATSQGKRPEQTLEGILLIMADKVRQFCHQALQTELQFHIGSLM